MKKLISLLLAALLVFSLLPAYAMAEETGEEAGAEAETEEAGYHAEEVIYGVLDAGGRVQKLLPVVVIDAAEDTELSYYGNFAETKNLSDTSKLKTEKGRVELQLPPGRFYFETELQKGSLPWIIDISYTLDGEKISPEKLGGKSGELEIGIDIKTNPKGDSSFFDSYLLQISLTLDSLKCRNIEAEGATMANAGSNKMVNFMAMPGSETELKLRADVENFAMGGMSIAAVPASMADMLDGMGGLSGGIDSFGSALNQLSEGVSMLAGGAGQLRDGFGMFAQGLVTLSANSSALVGGSAQILDGLRQISDMVAVLRELGSGIDLSTLQFVPGALYQLADMLDYAASILGDSRNGIEDAVSLINSLMDQIVDISEEELNALWQQYPNSPVLEYLIFNYRVLIALRDSWYQTVEGFLGASGGMEGAVTELINGAETARAIASGIEGILGGGEGDLSAYLDQLVGLGDNYAMFHEGLVMYTGGVDALAQAAIPLYGGSDALAGGTEQLNEGTAQIPGEIDGMLDSLLGEEFEPHSFLSDKNENVELVQFVLSTEAISAPEAEPQQQDTAEEKSGLALFFQRLSELFKKPESTEE